MASFPTMFIDASAEKEKARKVMNFQRKEQTERNFWYSSSVKSNVYSFLCFALAVSTIAIHFQRLKLFLKVKNTDFFKIFHIITIITGNVVQR